ncbi:MAG TPA: endonuclease/exonuclease/phosphatase family protein [Propionibacteriaceae bacterium]|nr:endonuclease/exonuclease/phosphatase family protein [Propionibacteriaceae bacterium]
MPALRVATLNLYGPPYRADERAELVVQGLARLRPDIVGLQEVNIGADIGTRICSELNVLVKGSTLRILHVANPGTEANRGALAVITHLPVLAHEGFDYLTEGLEWNRTVQRVRVDVEGQTVDFYNTHLHYQLGSDADAMRCEQVERLLAWMDSHGWDFPKMVVGDFNAWPDSRAVRLLKDRFRSAYQAVHGKEPEKTWPTPLLRQPSAPDWTLDYIFLSPGVRVTDAAVTFTEAGASDSGLYASDHFGLAASVELGA